MVRSMKRIFFAGAQSTGKTTALTNIGPLLPKLRVQPEVARQLMAERNWTRDDIFESKESCRNFQGDIVRRMEEIDRENENEEQDYISDRCPLDPLVYAMLDAGEEEASNLEENEAFQSLMRRLPQNSLTFLFYPSAKCIEDDHIRKKPEMAELFRYTECLESLLIQYRMPYVYVMTDDLMERIVQIFVQIEEFIESGNSF